MNTERLQKIQVQEVTLTNPTAAGTHETDFDLDTDYDKCTGIWVKAVAVGGLSNYFIGLSDRNGVIIDLSDADLMQAATSVAPNDKFLKVDFPIYQGQGLKIRVKNGAATDAAFTLEVHARLEKKGKKNV